MKICFVCDLRSPLSKNLIDYFASQNNNEILIISTFTAEKTYKSIPVKSVPIAFTWLQTIIGIVKRKILKKDSTFIHNEFHGGKISKLYSVLRCYIAPQIIPIESLLIRRLIKKFNPEIVHAMRIPFEGILTYWALKGLNIPYILSIWGNDLTLFASKYSSIGKQTVLALKNCAGLHTDCQRDISLAQKFGYSEYGQSIVIPGNGGIRSEHFFPKRMNFLHTKYKIPEENFIILNPRGWRKYIKVEEFLTSIPLVLNDIKNCTFICIGYEGISFIEEIVNRLGIKENIIFAKHIEWLEMPLYYSEADITISPSIFDGTPNSLLETMACGSFPISGIIDSVQEWIINKENGLLIDANDPRSIADGIVYALKNKEFRIKAIEKNYTIVKERADYATMMRKLDAFYYKVIKTNLKTQIRKS